MKRCWMLLVCLASSGVGCTTEEGPNGEVSSLVEKKVVPVYGGGPLTPAGPNEFWIVTTSPDDVQELRAARVNTKYKVLEETLRIQPNHIPEFNLHLGNTGGGYLKPVGPGTSPPPPPPVWDRYVLFLAQRGIELHDRAMDDALQQQPY